MPKIIRSTGINIERARPIVMPMRGQAKADAPQPAAIPVRDQQLDADKIKASAEIIVEEILNRARNDADNMLVNARAETMRVLQEAVQEGREQGLGEARAEWAALRETVESEYDAAAESLLNERRRIIRDMEGDVLALVFDIVDKVIGVEMDRGAAWIDAMVREALGQMEGDEGAVLKVAAALRPRVAETADRMLYESGKPHSGLTVVGDAGLPPGGCVIETGRGVINNSVESKLDKLKTILLENA